MRIKKGRGGTERAGEDQNGQGRLNTIRTTQRWRHPMDQDPSSPALRAAALTGGKLRAVEKSEFTQHLLSITLTATAPAETGGK